MSEVEELQKLLKKRPEDTTRWRKVDEWLDELVPKFEAFLKKRKQRDRELRNIIEDTKVDVLGMFCYQGPPTKHWIETKGQFWEGWNKGCDKILKRLDGLNK